MKGFPDLPPIWWLGSIAVIYAGRALAPGLHIDAPILGVAGWIVTLASLGVIFWAAFWFFRKKTPIEPHHDPKTLVIEGPYRLSRNPIYAALVGLTIGSALSNGSMLGFVVAAVLARVLHQRFVLPEEAGLRAAFGEEALAFISQTRRWI